MRFFFIRRPLATLIRVGLLARAVGGGRAHKFLVHMFLYPGIEWKGLAGVASGRSVKVYFTCEEQGELFRSGAFASLNPAGVLTELERVF